MKTTSLIRTPLLTLAMTGVLSLFAAASATAAEDNGAPPFSSDPKIKTVTTH